MLKTVDTGLMANHLPAHKAVISRLQWYLNHVQNPKISSILYKQIHMMKNHVNVMNQLLDPDRKNVSLPPIPQTAFGTNQNYTRRQEFFINENDIVVDAHFTASSMAKENFNSAENMKDPTVKKLHSEMALQQSTIAEMYEQYIRQMGWLNQPTASQQEQTSSMMPYQTVPSQSSFQGYQPVNDNY